MIASSTLYTAKLANPKRRKNLSSPPIASRPNTKELAPAVTTGASATPELNISLQFRSSNTAAAAVIGAEIMNENRAASARPSPTNLPPVIVEPEREIPGINAKHCATPTQSAAL